LEAENGAGYIWKAVPIKPKFKLKLPGDLNPKDAPRPWYMVMGRNIMKEIS